MNISGADGRYTLTPEFWPIPIQVEVRRWHADPTITQITFGAGWLPVPPEVKVLQAKMEQAKAVFQQDPAYAAYKKHHGNMCLYQPMSERLDANEAFVEYCTALVTEQFEHPIMVKDWLYSGNDFGWTCLIRKNSQPPETKE